MFNFGTPVEEKSNDLIEKDMLLWVRITVRGIKSSKQTNGRYVDLELTVAENQKYAGRKIWDTIMDPFDALNSTEAKEMGRGKIRRILEGVFGAHPSNEGSYNLPSWEALGGQNLVPILVGVQKAKPDSGYEDKNIVAEYLSPHSSVKKVVECYNLIRSGVNTYAKAKPAAPTGQAGFALTPAQPPQNGMFGQAQTAPVQSSAPGWLAPAQAAPVQQPIQQQQMRQAPVQQAAAPGFTQPQGNYVAPAVNTQQQIAPASVSTAPASPSNQGWQPPSQQFGTPAVFPAGTPPVTNQ